LTTIYNPLRNRKCFILTQYANEDNLVRSRSGPWNWFPKASLHFKGKGKSKALVKYTLELWETPIKLTLQCPSLWPFIVVKLQDPPIGCSILPLKMNGIFFLFFPKIWAHVSPTSHENFIFVCENMKLSRIFEGKTNITHINNKISWRNLEISALVIVVV